MHSDRQSSGAYRRFRQNKPALWALRGLYVLIFLAVFGDFLANEKPVLCRLEGVTFSPVLRDYGAALGWSAWNADLRFANWQELDYEWVFFAPIPYSARTIDRRNMRATAPGGGQQVRSGRFRHRLGTDELGRDVAAGLIAGARIALLVGILAMAIAGVIGLTLGSLAGYFGDRQVTVSRGWLIWHGLALSIALFYLLSPADFPWWRRLGLALLAIGVAQGLSLATGKVPGMNRRYFFPIDLLVMRLIEIMNSIPALLVILAIIATIPNPSIFHIMVIIGLIRWTTIARFIRAEMLRIKQQHYIEAAKALGFPEWRIILRHALPNGMGPVLITLAFGIAGAVLLEAFLSFLGIGLPPETVSWGSIMRKIQSNTGAWWLAVFPGLAIFLTVTIFNLIGEGLSEALDPASEK